MAVTFHLRFICDAETVAFDLAGSPVMAASLHQPSMLDTDSVAFDLVGTPVVAAYSHLRYMFDAKCVGFIPFRPVMIFSTPHTPSLSDLAYTTLNTAHLFPS